MFKNKKDDTHKELDRPGIRLRRRYPHSTPGEQAPRSPSGVCAPVSLRFARRKVGTKCDLRHQNKKDTHTECPFVLEVQAGFEPADNGVADRGLTTWLLHQNFLLPQHYNKVFLLCQGGNKKILQLAVIFEKLRREYRIRTSHYTVKIKETFYSPRNSSLEE